MHKLVWMMAVIGASVCWFAGCGGSNPAQEQLEIGIEWERQEEPLEAVKAFSQALELEPDHIEALYRRGRNHLVMGEHEEALSDYNRVLELDPLHSRALAGRAEIFLSQDRLDEAFRDASAALESNENEDMALYQRGRIQLARGEYKQAIKDLNDFVRMANQSRRNRARAQTQLGHVHFAMGDFAEAVYHYGLAVPEYEELMQRMPKHQVQSTRRDEKVWRGKETYDAAAEAYVSRAIAQYLRGNFNEALRDADKAARLNAELTEAFYQRARASAKIGNFFQARQDFQKAAELEPDRADIHSAWAWLLATCVRAGERDGPAALDRAQVACEMTDYKSPNALEALAAAYAETGDFNRAVQWQKEAIKLAGNETRLDRRQRLQLYEEGKPYREKLPR